MSNKSSIARPYAKAVFELAQKEHAFPKWSEMLERAAMVAEDKQVVNLMKDPNFSSEELLQLFFELGKELYTQEMQNFLRTVARFKRLNTLKDIAAEYEEMRAEAEKVVTVSLVSAFPLTGEYQQRFEQALKRRTNCNVVLECQTDKSILGGAIIRAGDLVIDGSLRGRLAKLSDAVGISW